MTAMRVTVSQVLLHYLQVAQLRRYLKQDQRSVSSPQFYYNRALHELSQRNTEVAIGSLIRLLDLDPRHQPALHLARTMLFGLNKLFQEAGGELYKARHPNLYVWRQQLEQQIQAQEVETKRLHNELLHTRQQKPGLLAFKHQRRLAELDAILQTSQQKEQKLQHDRTLSIKLAQIQDYSHVISLILESCLFPARYSWLMQEKKEQQGVETTWYG